MTEQTGNNRIGAAFSVFAAVPRLSVLRSTLASALLVVLVGGGVVFPVVHRVTHAVETEADRTEHVATFHPEAGRDVVEVPCYPLAQDVDCAVCSGLSMAADLPAPTNHPHPDTHATPGDWTDPAVRTTTEEPGARAPPTA